MFVAELTLLTPWNTFYVIIGTAAAALTGLMFVVITLIASIPNRRSGAAVGAFGTPTVVHFCSALLVAAMLSAPWQSLWEAGLLLGLTGLGGVTYLVIVVRRMRHQGDYQPVLEDWLWHVLFPFASYIVFVGAALLLPSTPVLALFSTAAAMLLLLFIGIHNAWDSVTYLIVERAQPEHKRQDD